MTQQTPTIDMVLGDLRRALIRRRARRHKRVLSVLAVVAAGVTATVALGATYGHWLSSPSAFRAVASPFPMPAFSGDDLLTGRRVDNAFISGHVGFILVWQSDCRPCDGELTAVESFAKANPSVPVVGLDVADLRRLGTTELKRLHVTSFPAVSANRVILTKLEIHGFPTVLAFNKKGKIVAIAPGYGGRLIAAELITQELKSLTTR